MIQRTYTKSPSPQRKGRRGGFTLIELMVASVVLILGLTSAIATIQISLRTLDAARATTLAGQIIQSEMERIRLLNWTDVANLPARAELNLRTLFPDSVITDEVTGRFSAVRTVTIPTGRDASMRSITVTVSWTGSEGGRHTRSSSTRYTNNGLYDYYYTRALR